MKVRLLIIAVFFLCGIAASTGNADEPKADVSYFTKLRIDYAKRDDFSPLWKHEDERKAVLEAYKTKEFPKLITLATKWLKKCPVDAEVYYLRSDARVKTGDIANYAGDLFQFYGLIQSIASSGDGLTMKTAFKVISVAEEYYLLRDFGAKVLSQHLIDHYDKMDCELPDKKKVTYYFDVSIPLSKEMK